MTDDWSREEVETTVADYFSMLLMDIRGETFNKAERNRNLQKLLDNRDRGSVEWKHRNISAILIQLGSPYVRGYKPAYNYQRILREVVEDQLASATELLETVNKAVTQPPQLIPQVKEILSILVSPPKRDERPAQLRSTPPSHRKAVFRDFLKTESESRLLGLAGEEFIVRYEHERLLRAGQKRLANLIEHVAKTQGDGLGYDILSFEENGRERLIEVKTTQFGEFTPFYATRNEVKVSEHRQVDYQLYRLYSFRREPKLYVLPGSLTSTCVLDPSQFVAFPLPIVSGKRGKIY